MLHREGTLFCQRCTRRDNMHESSLYAPEFPVLLHDHSLGFGLRLGSVVLLETQPAFGERKKQKGK